MAEIVGEHARRVEAMLTDALRRTAIDKGAGIVLGAVYAIGIGGEKSDALYILDGEREAQGKGAVAPALAVPVAHRDGGFPARKQHHRRRKWPPPRFCLPGNGRVHAGDLLRLPFDGVRQNDRFDAPLFRRLRRCLKRKRGRGDDGVGVPGEDGIGRPRRVGLGALQMLKDRGREREVVAGHDVERLLPVAMVGDGGTRGDKGGVIARDIGNQHGVDPRARHRRQAPALDAR